jgi:hypothetical protein
MDHESPVHDGSLKLQHKSILEKEISAQDGHSHARTDKQGIQPDDLEAGQLGRRGMLTWVGLEAVESAVDAMVAGAGRRRRSSELALPVSTGLQMRHGLYVLLGSGEDDWLMRSEPAPRTTCCARCG